MHIHGRPPEEGENIYGPADTFQPFRNHNRPMNENYKKTISAAGTTFTGTRSPIGITLWYQSALHMSSNIACRSPMV